MIAKLWQQYGEQFVRFFVVGVGATLLHWGIYILLNCLFGLTDAQSLALSFTYAAGYLISFAANYVASLKWTFKTEGSVSKGLGFMFSHGVNFGLHIGLLNLFLWAGLGTWMVSTLQNYTPWLTEWVPALNDAANLLPLPVFVIVVPVNFLMVRFFLTRGDKLA